MFIDWVLITETLQGINQKELRQLLSKLDPEYDYTNWEQNALVQAVLLCYIAKAACELNSHNIK